MAKLLIPRHARCVESTSVIADETGARAILRRYEGRASDGYKTDYERRPAEWLLWLRVEADGRRSVKVVKRYSGKRLATAKADYDTARTALLIDGLGPVEDKAVS